ncbi:hypothetical protein [uncultured Xanthomonas sp.]|uniref:hypothetical protein n=1 Tax=uncultured Xanthomonas sp. TaxID=152831 RepID=UPI0025CDA8C9|nr:hypothetical protein [uncultured Xanthomonas sp.]
MADNEQAIADIFNDYMRERCQEQGQPFQAFGLGGQDRDAADYLIAGAHGFALIEFKHSESAITSEGKKPRRKNLCLLLQQDDSMRTLHDLCHFIAWEDRGTGDIRCAPYRTQVCNQHVFAECAGLRRKRPLKHKQLDATQYCNEFLRPPPHRYATKKEFERYLRWLMKDASGSENETVQLMARAPMGCATVRFESVDAAYRWMQDRLGFSSGMRPA